MKRIFAYAPKSASSEWRIANGKRAIRYFAASLFAATFSLAPAQTFAILPLTGAGGGSPAASGPTGMVSVVLTGGNSASNPSNSAIYYSQLVSGYSPGWVATLANAAQPVAVAGVISNLHVVFQTPITTGSYEVGINQNGTDISSNGFECQVSSTAKSCDYLGTLTVNPGDSLAIESSPTGTPTAQTAAVQVSFLYQATSGQNQSISFGSSSTQVSNSVNDFIGPYGPTAPQTIASEVTISGITPVAGTINGLYVQTNGTSPGTKGTQYYTATIFHNGSATSMTCQINNPSAGTTCGTTANPVSLSANDSFSVEISPTGTPTAAKVSAAIVWTPSTAGQALLLLDGKPAPPTQSATTAEYLNANGLSNSEATESAVEQVVPQLGSGHTLTIGNLISSASNSPGANYTRTVNLRAGGTNDLTANICTYATATVGGVASTPYCSDLADTYQPSSTTLLDWLTALTCTSSCTAGTTLTSFKIAATEVYQ
jgi:hypothetical protein